MATIKLDNWTMNVLKNFSGINPSIVFKPGQQLTTVSPTKKVLAKAGIGAKVDAEFGIFELNKLFGAISLFNEPAIKIERTHLSIGEGDRVLKYSTANPSDILSPDVDMPWELPTIDVEFGLSADMLKNLMKAAGVLSQPHIVFEGDGSKISISTRNMEKPTSETYSENVGHFEGGEDPFKIVLKVENLKLIPGNYIVRLSKELMLAQFIHADEDLIYIVAVESNGSTF